MDSMTEHPDVLRLVVLFLRNYADLTQVELGRAARVHQGRLSVFETGDKTPPDEVLRRLAAAAGVPWPLVAHLRRFYAALLAAMPKSAAFEETAGDLQTVTLSDSPFLAVQSYLIEDTAEAGG